MKTTERGKEFYPPDGYYIANCKEGEQGTPCTCTECCSSPCKGGCGCLACGEAYGDFLGGTDE